MYDLYNGHQNVMEESIEIPNIPECYNITVWASNKAGTSDPTIYSSPTSCMYYKSFDHASHGFYAPQFALQAAGQNLQLMGDRNLIPVLISKVTFPACQYLTVYLLYPKA